MKKDSRKSFAARGASTARKGRHRLKVLVIIFMILILTCATGCLFVKYKKPALLSQLLSPLQHHLVKVKEVVVNKQPVLPPPEIHFEFYNTLPKMQIKVAANPVPHESARSGSLLLTGSRGQVTGRQLAGMTERTAKQQPTKIFDAARLENSLADEIQKSEK